VSTPNPPAPWRLLEPLGRGGQATTYKAENTATGQVVALKVFRLADADGWKAYELFERECATRQTLDHPGIPRYVAHFGDPDRGELYLATELFPGRSLADRVAGGATFAPGELLVLLRQALAILAYLHDHTPPIVHRDIKPANLLLASDGRLALIDFGSVRSAIRPVGTTMVGTLGFMAPEQLQGQASPATDLYALGVTLAVLATGLAPEALPRRRLALDLDAVMPPGPLREVIAAMTAPDPDDRLGSVAEVRALLDGIPGPSAAAAPGAPRAVSATGLPGFVGRLLLFVVWLASTALGLVLGLFEAVLPLAHARKRRRVERRLGHRPVEGLTRIAALDAAHDARMDVLRATRTNIRAVAARSEPYQPPRDARPAQRRQLPRSKRR